MAKLDIPTKDPVVTEDVVIKGRTYDQYHLAALVLQNFDLNGQMDASLELVKYGLDDEGKKVAAPGPSVTINIKDILGKAASDSVLAQAIQSMLEAVAKTVAAYEDSLAKKK